MTSGKDVAKAAHGAGFPDGELVTAVAISFAESGWNANATHRNNNGSIDYGLWQINSIHNFPELTSGAWRDPDTNARLAYSVWKGQGWNAWSTHKPTDPVGYARYTAAIPVAAAAVAAAGFPGAAAGGAAGVPGDVIEGASGGASDALSGAAAIAKQPLAVLDFLTQPDTWVRISKIVIGGVLVMAGAYLFVQSTTLKTVAPIAGNVIGVGGKIKAVKGVANAAKSVGE